MRVTAELPDLASSYSVVSEATAGYRRAGHVLLRSVCTPAEVAAYRDAIRDATLAEGRKLKPLVERDTYGKAFIQVMNLWRKDPRVAEFVLAKRFGEIAAALIGCERVRIYHDQALFKEPGGGHTPWHQDGFYWPLDASRTVTMWMPLVDISADMGSMSFASGSHRDGFVPIPDQISDASEAYFDKVVRERGYSVVDSGAMAAGDATWHSGVTLHRAVPNRSDRLREVMTVIYFADGERVQEPKNKFQQVDMEVWFPGCQPGDLAASELNPLV